MTHISFYVLAANHPAGPVDFACQMAAQFYQRGSRACLLTPDAVVAEALDQRLWDHAAESFVPHQQWGPGRESPADNALLLGWDEPPHDQHEILINLQDSVPLCFSRFDRLVEIIDAAAPEAGRERYQFYRDRGYPLTTHKITA